MAQKHTLYVDKITQSPTVTEFIIGLAPEDHTPGTETSQSVTTTIALSSAEQRFTNISETVEIYEVWARFNSATGKVKVGLYNSAQRVVGFHIPTTQKSDDLSAVISHIFTGDTAAMKTYVHTFATPKIITLTALESFMAVVNGDGNRAIANNAPTSSFNRARDDTSATYPSQPATWVNVNDLGGDLVIGFRARTIAPSSPLNNPQLLTTLALGLVGQIHTA